MCLRALGRPWLRQLAAPGSHSLPPSTRALARSSVHLQDAAAPKDEASDNGLDVGGHAMKHDPALMEEAKERALRGQGNSHAIPGMEGWEYNMASASEAIVKADQAADLPPEEMQRLTVNWLGEDAQRVAHLAQPEEKRAGLDVTGEPDVQQNIEKSRNPAEPAAKGAGSW